MSCKRAAVSDSVVVREAGATLASSAAAAMVRRVQFQFRALVVFLVPVCSLRDSQIPKKRFLPNKTHKSRPRAPKTLQNFKTTKTSKTKQKHTKTEELQRFTGSLCIIYPSTLLSPLDTPRSSSMAAAS